MTALWSRDADSAGSESRCGSLTRGFDSLWEALVPVGLARSGGYRRFAWTAEDSLLREWFAGEAAARGLDLVTDRCGNQWAWWGDPDVDGPGVVLGSHLDSVPDGGAFDGPLGVVSAFAALDELRARGVVPARPIAVAHFADEEGARFGVACAGSRLLTGLLDPERARALTGPDGVSMAEAMTRAGHDPAWIGRDTETLRRIGTYVELHVEQGRGLVDLDRPVAVGSAIWPHGRWRITLPGRADHAGTTRLADRDDPMLALADVVQRIRAAAERHDAVATCGKVTVEPNAVNAIPSQVTAWLDARGADEARVTAVVSEVIAAAREHGGTVAKESWTRATTFDAALGARLASLVGDAPVLPTGAGHDAGILASVGIPAAMLYVRNPTGISHAPEEHAHPEDCHQGVEALTAVAEHLAR
jgi:N-carbamoyl-L-amino-acid hydrolase